MCINTWSCCGTDHRNGCAAKDAREAVGKLTDDLDDEKVELWFKSYLGSLGKLGYIQSMPEDEVARRAKLFIDKSFMAKCRAMDFDHSMMSVGRLHPLMDYPE